MFSWSMTWYIEGILGKKQRYIHGILNDTLKVYDMVYLSTVFQQEYEKILKIY